MSRIIIAAMMALTLGVSAQAEVKFGQKIVGGVPAEKGELPFQVSMQTTSGSHFCGGSLIKPNWVATAAHCVQRSATSFRIVAGLHNQKDMTGTEVFRVKRVIAHPQYNRSTLDFDYALVELEGNSTFSTIDLNRVEIDIAATPLNVTTSGWGTTSEGSFSLPNILNKVEVPLVTTEECNSATAYNGDITTNMICAGLKSGGKDSCQGDSGGPLFVKEASGHFTLIGIVSWGEGCARPNKYGVYSKVNVMTDWFDQNSQ